MFTGLTALFTALSLLFSQSIQFMRSISPFASQVTLAQHQAVQVVYQQAQSICGVCQAQLEQNAHDIIVTACNGVFHGTHVECMRTVLLHQDVLTCPTCNTALSESNVEHVMLILNGDDVQSAAHSGGSMTPDVLYPNLETNAPMMASSSSNYGYHMQPNAPVVRECAICLDSMSDDDILALPCAHVFHEDCVRPWVHQNHTCPTCRRNC